MTPETPIPPSSEREAQITALLLGELPSEEAFVLGRAIEQDPELRNLYQRLKATIPLVKEATAVPVEQVAPVFSENRRQALLQHFKTVKPKEFSTAPGKRVRWLEMAAVLAIVALLAAALLPSLARSKSRSLSASRDISFYRQRESEDKLRQGDGFADNESLARKLPEMPPPVGTKQSGEFAGTPGTKPSSIILPPLGESTSEKKPASLFDDDATGTLAQNASTRRSGADGWGQVTNGFGEPQSADALDGFSKSPLLTTNAFVSRYPYTSSDTNQLTLPFGNGQDLAGDRNGTQSFGWSDAARQKQGNFEVAGGRLSPLSREKLQESLTNSVDKKSESAAIKPVEELAKNTKDGVDFFYELGKTDLPSNGNLVTGLTMERRLNRAGLDDASSATSHSVKLKSDSDMRPATRPLQVEAAQKSTPTITAEKEGKSLAEGDWRFSTTNPNVGWLADVATPSPSSTNTLGTSNDYSLGVAGYAHAPSSNTLASDEISLGLNSGASGGFGGRAFKGIVLPQTNNDKSVALNFRTPSPETTVPQLTPQDLALNNNKRAFQMAQGLASEPSIVSSSILEPEGRSIPKSPLAGGVDSVIDKSKEVNSSSEPYFEAMRKRYGLSLSPIPGVKTPQAYARATLSGTNSGRAAIAGKLERIRIDQVQITGAPLSEVVNYLNDQARMRDPEKRGINFLINPQINLTIPSRDPSTGLPPMSEPSKLGEISMKMQLENASLVDVLDSIVRNSPEPIQYSIEDYGVVISPRNQSSPGTVPAKDPDPVPRRPAATNAPIPQPEVDSRENPFSTFSLNVSDVSFKLSAASLEKGVIPEAGSIRSEEFINAFDYHDPEPSPGAPVGFSWERARYPFAQNRDVVRFSLKTAAEGRQAGRPMNLVLLLDNSGSMERADRVEIIHQALRVLATQLHPNDKLSVVTFARTARLWVDGVPGSQAAQVADGVSNLTPQGGTNLEEAMKLAYQTALRHFLSDGINRVVLLTDGAANLGDVEPANLRQMVESNRKQGIALDCFGIGWEGYNDELLESLSRNGDGRYGFLNTPEEVSTGFANQLAGALHVAASDVKVQVEFNTNRVKAYRQIGYAKHQLTKEQFRDNTVDAAELAAAESGNALYIVEVNPEGQGPLGTVRVRYKLPGTSDYREQEWSVPYTGSAVALQQSAPSLRLASTASAFSEWLAASPFASDLAPEKLIELLRGVPEVYGADPRPKKLEWMLRQANSLIGNAEVKAKTPVKSATADRDPGRVQFP